MKQKNNLNNYAITKLLLVLLIIFSITSCKGPQGDPGPAGTTGAQGTAGLNGNTIVYGTSAPTASVGNNGDFYINTSTDFIYGPKASGTWPAGVSLVGPQGAMGAAGANGNTIVYGATAPTASTGNNGDFYINVATDYIYGPKANGAWPAGVSIIGPQGVSGIPTDSTSVGLVGFWKFNGNANDASGHGYNGTAINITKTYDRFGRANGAFYFDGGSSYVTIPFTPALQLTGTDYTINFWLKMASYNNHSPASTLKVIQSDIFIGNGYYITIGGDYNYVGAGGNDPSHPTGVLFCQNSNAFGYINAIYPLDLEEWHMITLVFTQANGGTLKLFIDGYYNNSVANAGPPNGVLNNPLSIGANATETPLGIDGGPGGFSNFLNGTMNDVRIYNQALSDTRIIELKNDTSNE